MVRLIDIAHEAGVSRPVVSAVLSGGRSTIRVAPEKAEEIRVIARRLKYRPNISARILNGKSSKSIGVLIDSKAPAVTFQLLGSIEHHASLRGFRVLVGEAHDDVKSHYENYLGLCQYGVDGVICISHDYPGDNDELAALFADAENVVFINRPEVGTHPLVRCDTAAGIRNVVKHLTDAGKRRIAIACRDTGSRSAAERLRGFLEARPGGEEWIFRLPPCERRQDISRENAVEIIRQMVREKGADALIANNDCHALMLLSILRDAGFRVPEDVAVVGYDDEPFCVCVSPRLSSVNPRADEVAGKAVELLLAIVAGKESPREIVIEPELIVRESSLSIAANGKESK